MQEINNQQNTLPHREPPRYLTCDQWVAKYGFPTISGLRWMIYRAKNDPELRKIFIRVGRRVLLKEEEVFRYLEEMDKKDLEKKKDKIIEK